MFGWFMVHRLRERFSTWPRTECSLASSPGVP